MNSVVEIKIVQSKSKPPDSKMSKLTHTPVNANIKSKSALKVALKPAPFGKVIKHVQILAEEKEEKEVSSFMSTPRSEKSSRRFKKKRDKFVCNCTELKEHRKDVFK